LKGSKIVAHALHGVSQLRLICPIKVLAHSFFISLSLDQIVISFLGFIAWLQSIYMWFIIGAGRHLIPMEQEHQLGKHRRGESPPPLQIVDAALARIQPDGSVIAYDDEYKETVIFGAYESVPLDKLPPDVYASHLLELADTIYGAVLHIANWPDSADNEAKTLAIYLTQYRHAPGFIRHAASLTKVDKGGLRPPYLPPGSPWDWVPQLRLALY
jgi:hypothetical protein